MCRSVSVCLYVYSMCLYVCTMCVCLVYVCLVCVGGWVCSRACVCACLVFVCVCLSSVRLYMCACLMYMCACVYACVCFCMCVRAICQSYQDCLLHEIALAFLMLPLLIHRAADTRHDYINQSHYPDTGPSSLDSFLLMLSV